MTSTKSVHMGDTKEMKLEQQSDGLEYGVINAVKIIHTRRHRRPVAIEVEKATHSFLGNCSWEDEVEMRMGCGDVPGDDVSEAGRSRSVTLNLAVCRII